MHTPTHSVRQILTDVIRLKKKRALFLLRGTNISHFQMRVSEGQDLVGSRSSKTNRVVHFVRSRSNYKWTENAS